MVSLRNDRGVYMRLRNRCVMKVSSNPKPKTKKIPRKSNKIVKDTKKDVGAEALADAEEEKFYQEFSKIFDDSQRAWRSNKIALGNGCYMYKK